MPPPRTTPRWPSTDKLRQKRKRLDGYVEEARTKNPPGRCALRYKLKRKTIPLLFIPENEPAALKALDTWILEVDRLQQQAQSVDEEAGSQRSFRASYRAFWDDRIRSGNDLKQQKYRLTFRAAFPDADGDWVLSDDELYSRMKKWLANPLGADRKQKEVGGGFRILPRRRLDDDTVAKHCQRIRAFVRYCLGRRWLTADPFLSLEYPKEQSRAWEDRQAYSHDEQRRIVEYYRSKAAREPRLIDPRAKTALDYIDLWTLLSYTGARISEALALRWESADPLNESHMTDAGIHFRKTKTEVDRNFPFRLFPDLAAMLDRRRRDRSGEFVFPWRTLGPVERSFKACLKDLGIPINSRYIHVWRATAEHRLIYEYHVPEALALQLVGHGEKRYKQHYKIIPSADEMAGLVLKAGIAGPGQSMDNQPGWFRSD